MGAFVPVGARKNPACQNGNVQRLKITRTHHSKIRDRSACPGTGGCPSIWKSLVIRMLPLKGIIIETAADFTPFCAWML